MKTIKIQKTIEEMPLNKAVLLVLGALVKPQRISKRKWQNQITEDLLSGRKVFRIRETRLMEQSPC